MHSLGLTGVYLGSVGHTWLHFGSVDVTCITWVHLGSFGFTLFTRGQEDEIGCRIWKMKHNDTQFLGCLEILSDLIIALLQFTIVSETAQALPLFT